jgi:hypothetical protein
MGNNNTQRENLLIQSFKYLKNLLKAKDSFLLLSSIGVTPYLSSACIRAAEFDATKSIHATFFKATSLIIAEIFSIHPDGTL